MNLMTWNPFDWTAVPFLSLYLTVAVAIFAWGFSLKSRIGPAARMTHKLSALELAYLAGGAHRVGDAVLLSLTSGNGATITGNAITVTDQAPLAALIGRVPLLPFHPGMSRREFQTAVTSIVERVQSRLQQFGYSPTDEQMESFRMGVLPFVGLLLAFGIFKIMLGMQRHHPVGILVCLLFMTGLAGILLAKHQTRTRAGKEALQTYQTSHARASRAPLDHELLFAVALSGAVVLSGTPYASVYAASQTMSSGGGDGGSGCGGGGGGGCGGCSA
jgi:uncharacterized protein (TIGR04222 family)